MKRKALFLMLMLALAIGLVASACGDDDTTDGDTTDGDTTDGDTADGDTEDGDVEDGDVEDGDVEDGDVEDGDVEDGDVEDGDVEDGDVEDGDVEDGDVTDGDVTDGDEPLACDEDLSDGGFGGMSMDACDTVVGVCENGVTIGDMEWYPCADDPDCCCFDEPFEGMDDVFPCQYDSCGEDGFCDPACGDVLDPDCE